MSDTTVQISDRKVSQKYTASVGNGSHRTIVADVEIPAGRRSSLALKLFIGGVDTFRGDWIKNEAELIALRDLLDKIVADLPQEELI